MSILWRISADACTEREAVAGIRALSLYIHRAWRRVERIVSLNELPDDAGPSRRAGCSRPSEQFLKNQAWLLCQAHIEQLAATLCALAEVCKLHETYQ
jgi:hypothetical protein